jgi:hypothetical protein
MTFFESSFKKLSWEVHPAILPFITAMTVKEKKTKALRAYVAPVNHNVFNEAEAINIAHTMMGNFCHGNESKVIQMEQMGNDSCMIVGYHDKVSENSELSIILFQIEILCLLHMLFLIKHFRINKRRDIGSYTSSGAPSICPRCHVFFSCKARHLLAVDISCTSQL